MNNKMLALFGIGAYFFSILSSAEIFQGSKWDAPAALIVATGTTTIFIVMAIKRLWKDARGLSLTLAFSTISLFLLTVVLAGRTLSYGSPIVILGNMARSIYFITLVWAIVKLFRIK